MKSLESKILKRYGIEKANKEKEKNNRYKHLNEQRLNFERRKWKKELDEYNRKNKKNIIFCYELSENIRLPVNRGKYTIDYWRKEEEKKIYRQLYGQRKEIKIENVMLVYENIVIMKKATVEKNKKCQIVKLYLLKENRKLYCEQIKYEDLPEKVRINGEEYKKKDLEIEMIKYRVKVYEVISL